MAERKAHGKGSDPLKAAADACYRSDGRHMVRTKTVQYAGGKDNGKHREGTRDCSRSFFEAPLGPGFSCDQQKRADSLELAQILGVAEPFTGVLLGSRCGIGDTMRFHLFEAMR